MKAPDKIYINKYMLRLGMLYPAQPPADTPEYVYIRKDALLEWAKDLRENARRNRENPPSVEFDRYMEGKEATLSKLIYKLNSL